MVLVHTQFKTNLRCLSLELCLSTGLALGSSASGSLKLSSSMKYGFFPDKLAGIGLLLSFSESKSVSDMAALARLWISVAADNRRLLLDRGRLEGLQKEHGISTEVLKIGSSGPCCNF